MDMTILAKKAKTMDRISQLPDDLLLRILSFLPTTKYVVETMVLSQRWQFLWMMVPKLVYDGSYQNIEHGRFSRFVNRSLFMHEVPVVETLHFKLAKTCGSGDLQVWVGAVEKRRVRELIIETDTPITLPGSLYRCCRMLVTLKLSNVVLVDDVTFPISFPSLKQLSLVSVKYPGGDEFVSRLLSSCPVLEELAVEQCPDDNVAILSVRVPTLKSLSLHKPLRICTTTAVEDGFVIDAPSLECLDIVDYESGLFVIENDMPNAVKARVAVVAHGHYGVILSSFTSAKFLYLCLPYSEAAYSIGSVFHRLVYLEMCTCEPKWLKSLMSVLRDSPNLRSLKLQKCHDFVSQKASPCLKEPSSVPECLLSSLETLEWVKYEGTKEEKEVAAFIFRNARCLKKATIIASKSIDPNKKLEMLKELSLSPRLSGFGYPRKAINYGQDDISKKKKSKDRISQLPDDLLLRILSLLPTTKDVVETMVLSKRWQFLWTMVPRLAFDYDNQDSYEEFTRFVDRSLFLHEAPVIEALHFILDDVYDSKDIRVWIRAAEKRSVRELIIEIDCDSPPVVELPRSLYRSYRMLVTLKLRNAVLVDDVTCPVSFPSLKKLSLESMKYPDHVFVDNLLSGCPVLEDLVVEKCPGDNVPILSVRMLHLKSLALSASGDDDSAEGEEHGFVIDTPSLECLDIDDYDERFCVIENNMSKILKAKVLITRPDTEHLVGSITAAKRLCLCLPTSKVGTITLFMTIFCLSLTQNVCLVGSVMRVLNDSPNLQSLKLKLKKYHHIDGDPRRPCWNEPSSIPECLLSSLEAFEWVRYQGTEEEKEVVAFILRNASCLEKVTISPKSPRRRKKLEMIKELSFLPRRSPTCRITFG